jgi:hypothetical protein
MRKMTTRRLFRTLAIGVVILGAATLARAASSSGVAFQPFTDQDAPFIGHDPQGAYNDDTASPHFAIAQLGVVDVSGSGATSHTTDVYVHNNGLYAFRCTVYYTKATDGSSVNATGQTTKNGNAKIAIPVTIPAGNAGTVWGGSVTCNVPQRSGSNRAEIYAVTTS